MPTGRPRFKVDENLPAEFLSLLADAGFDALGALDQRLGGASDGHMADTCRTENRVIVSLDLDFGDIRQYPPEEYAGLIVLRVKHQAKRHLLEVFGRVVTLLASEPIAGQLWIVTEAGVRVRGGEH